jgi:hypothetical protein
MRAPRPHSPVQENLLRTLSASMHHMAQPLSIIQASLELALLKPTTARQFREVAEEALRQLGRTVDTLHFAAQLTRFHQPAADTTDILLSPVLQEVIADLGRTLATAQIKLSLVHSGHERELQFSPTRLRQLFFYIFQALQHLSQPGDIVRIAIQAHAAHVALRISNVPGCTVQSTPQTQSAAGDEVATRALALAEAIVASAGAELTVTSSPLLIIADFPVHRLSQPHPAGKHRFDRPTPPQLEANTH